VRHLILVDDHGATFLMSRLGSVAVAAPYIAQQASAAWRAAAPAPGPAPAPPYVYTMRGGLAS
jgi:hypothetical protein